MPIDDYQLLIRMVLVQKRFDGEGDGFLGIQANHDHGNFHLKIIRAPRSCE
jgi:hypothetical protein